MPDFRLPNLADAIGEAVKRATDPQDNEDGGLATQLLGENFREIEDAISKGGVTGAQLIQGFEMSDEGTLYTYDWTLPAERGLYITLVTLSVEPITKGWEIELTVGDAKWYALSGGVDKYSAVTGFLLGANGQTGTVGARFYGAGLGAIRDMTLYGGAIKILS